MTTLRDVSAQPASRWPASLPIGWECHGCGYRLPDDEPVRLSCPMARAGDDVDHVLRRVVDYHRLRFPPTPEPNPFVRFRTLLYGYHAALSHGADDAAIVRRIRDLDARVATVDRGFVATPFARAGTLSRRLGFAPHAGVWIKDETNNVSGSHKARHLFGTLLELELAGDDWRERPLAIASCGNAALAAAVVARAADRRLLVFIPTDADPSVVARLDRLGAEITICERAAGGTGDPTYARLLEAISQGAIPFTCQGNLNGLAIEGGMTLAWEMVADLLADHRHLDHLVIQVGGGALASSVIQALDEVRELGVTRELPRIHTVQTRSAHPLARAYERLAERLGDRRRPDALDDLAAWAAAHRSQFMRPWETTPHSIAAGILDDETYDWLAVVSGMLASDGLPLVVDEDSLLEANHLARSSTRSNVDHTGSAGLAGVIDLVRRGVIGPEQSTAVIFTGVRRHSSANGGHP